MGLRIMRRWLLALCLMAASGAQAATDFYGTLLSGTYQPSETFAALTYEGAGNVYNFTLDAYDLDAIFTSGAFIGAIAVDSAFVPTISNVTGGTVVSVSPGGGPGGGFDFRFDLTGPQQTRLTANESVSFTATFSDPVVLSANSFALHVQGLSEEQGGSAWYTSAPIPEPSTYGMILAGLGLVGFVGRKRLMR
jgi:hypothetical protein